MMYNGQRMIQGIDIFWIHYENGLWVIALKNGNFIATNDIVEVNYKTQGENDV